MRIRDMEAGKDLAMLHQLNGMKRERDVIRRELSRMEERRKELEGREVKNPERKARFIRRLEGEIRQHRERLEMLEANIAGMEAEA